MFFNPFESRGQLRNDTLFVQYSLFSEFINQDMNLLVKYEALKFIIIKFGCGWNIKGNGGLFVLP